MTWVLWRQYRTTVLIAGVLLVLTITFLLISGFHILAVAQQLGVMTSCAHNQDTGNCLMLGIAFDAHTDTELAIGVLWLSLFPLLIGLFVGAPLIAREWEQGTYRLVWTQSISRSRWLIHRLCILIAVILLISIIPALLSSWWSGPRITISNGWENYDIRGFVPVAYALFAFALGTACGTLLRKTLPAMAATLLFFLLVRIAITIWLRPYFLPPMVAILDPNQVSPLQLDQTSWVVQIQRSDPQGHLISYDEMTSPCLHSENVDLCEHDHGIYYYVLYQPTDRFWQFQGMEATLYLVLSFALLGLTFWLVRKRLC